MLACGCQLPEAIYERLERCVSAVNSGVSAFARDRELGSLEASRDVWPQPLPS
jgi:hypothetical protein